MNVAVQYPQAPGFKVDVTSATAAQSVAGRSAIIREKVLAALAKGDLTPDECAGIIGEEKHSVRSRFSELVRLGLIFKLKETRRNASGLFAHVHSIVPEQFEL